MGKGLPAGGNILFMDNHVDGAGSADAMLGHLEQQPEHVV